ncbi:hypothetical protein [Hyalangium minutum]|uniref:Uncharacterized protein n=1 Tax=Hyalangium minutum TaxID=394096 RepID=A0A085WAF2_9BACT|nr:hypothetical protein [Hyalangium minutum]KFE64665.1 hypothetical protein DB31_1683 [Hyalangium minutum]
MTKINSSVAGPILTPSQPTLPSPTLPRPVPLPLPPPKPGTLDKFLTPVRSQQLANTQGSQLDTIQKGLKSGALTEKEASKLLSQQAKIAGTTARAGADGVITAKEAANIRRLQTQAGLDAFAATHNRARGTAGDPTAKAQASQIGQIAQGVRNGSLTGAEANTLLTDQADIAQTVADAKADGEVDFIEEQMVNIRQDAASYEIGKEKLDGEKAPHAKRLNFPVVF